MITERNIIGHLLPLKIISAAYGHTVMKYTHSMYHLLLDLRHTNDLEIGQKVICYSNQSIFWPAAEPVHRTSAD